MYEAFFGLRDRPFPAVAGPDEVVPTAAFQGALEQLRRCAQEGSGIGIVTAPSGAGKTSLCRALCRRAEPRLRSVFLGTSGFATRRALLQAILFELGQSYSGLSEQEARLELLQYVRTLAPEQDGLLLVVDEAHRLNPRLLEELRSLTNHAQHGKPLVRLVLSGQLELEEQLADRDLDALNQRVTCQVALESLTQEESAEYMAYRLERAGTRLADLFTPESVRFICGASDGNLRCLNQLCDHSLLLAFVAEEKPISAATVRSALDDLQALPLSWNLPSGALSDDGLNGDDVEPPEAADPDRAIPSGRTTGPVDVETLTLSGREPAAGPDAGDDVAVIEIGGDEPMRAINETTESRLSGVLEIRPADVAPASGSSTRHPLSDGPFDIVEVDVDDPYARLDRIRERRDDGILRPTRGDEGVAEHGEQMSLSFPVAVDQTTRNAATDDIVIEEDDIEDRLLDQVNDLRDAIHAAAADCTHLQERLLWSGVSSSWERSGDVFDVVEPDFNEPAPDLAGSVHDRPPTVSRSGAAIDEGDTETPRASETPVAATATGEAALAPGRRYSQLFTRLRRRRRETTLRPREAR